MLFPLYAIIAFFVISFSAQAEPVALFSMKSSSFAEGKNIPALYTCDGSDRSPQLRWKGAPAKTKTYVLIANDPDAPGGTWYHWVVYNIPNTIKLLTEGSALPAGASLGKNSWGRMQYNGPCPPASSIHRYYFTLYALDIRLPLPSGAEVMTVVNAMQGHILGEATLVALFGR